MLHRTPPCSTLFSCLTSHDVQHTPVSQEICIRSVDLVPDPAFGSFLQPVSKAAELARQHAACRAENITSAAADLTGIHPASAAALPIDVPRREELDGYVDNLVLLQHLAC